MQKSLSVRIAQRMKKENLYSSAQNRATFLALRIDIQQALNDGWSIKSIWETLYQEKKVTFSYQVFRRYVNKLIPSLKTETNPSAICKTFQGKKQQPSQISGFTFQPNLDKKDLL